MTIAPGPIDESIPFTPSAFVSARYARAAAFVLRSNRSSTRAQRRAELLRGCRLAKTQQGPVKKVGPTSAEPLATLVRKFPGFELS